MNFIPPPMYDVTNIDMWKFKMSVYLKSLGLHVYLATIKKSYLDNDKYIEANTQALEALKYTCSTPFPGYVPDACPNFFGHIVSVFSQ